VVGGRAFTSVILQRNCHEFIAYENLMRRPAPSRGPRAGGAPSVPSAAQAYPMAQAFPIVRRALKILADREVSPQTGLLKSTLLQLDSTFSERSYGASTFLDFVEKLAQSGLVLLKHAGRSVMVELNPAFSDETELAKAREGEGAATEADNVVAFRPAGGEPQAPDVQPAAAPGTSVEAVPRLGETADGVRAAAQLLAGATTARWPMYLRNVKQIFRAANFDERRYGFGGQMDLLTACQRDGLVRIERDRRGGLRVFQGPNLARPSQPEPSPAVERPEGDDTQPIQSDVEVAEDVATVAAVDVTDDTEPDVIEVEPVSVVDTTAELLGRATAKGSRSRAPRSGLTTAAASTRRRSTSGSRKGAAKKSATAGKRSSRSRKPSDKDDDSFGNR
jgi:hypothetical protein